MKAEIFVEGIADQKFIADYLTYLNAGTFPVSIKIVPMGGIGELKNTTPSFISNDKTGVKNILIIEIDMNSNSNYILESIILAPCQ